MNTRCTAVRLGARVVRPSASFSRSKFFAWLVVGLLLGSSLVTWAEEPDVKYMRSYYAIEKADALAKTGKADEAKAKYLEAQTMLKDIKTISPTWNSKAVAYRMSYVTEKIDALSKPPGASSTEVSGATANAQSSSLAPGTSVKLLSPGAEPKQTLRFQTKPGEAQKLVMTLQMAMGMSGGELMKMPPIKLDLNVETKSVSAGDINCEMRIDDVGFGDAAGSAPQVVDAMKASLGNLKGMVIASTVSDRGSNKKTEVRPPAGADATARQSMEQMKDSFQYSYILLPEEPVGPDAKWEVKQKIKAQGMTMDQTTTYHLVSMEGSVLTIESSVQQSAANQKMANPAMPQLKVDLTKMTGASKGQATVDLTKVLPTAVTMDGGSEMVMSAGAGAQAQTMTMKTELNLKIEAK